ncbi:FliM/FliN family flagellar motor switch protein [Buchnera aphidicola]|uniref:Flagellar motor switch protein FliN n=1 Tax=Buchnera aphidicola subsp. Cinara cedri (strain Cc) TaxID=372461 RepID=Q058C3_BUCCC|nr:FliM/FliN family flagellar motor switch protein [Buchnera aphidicola]ABJ90526.1 flagellar motor switch protein, C-ring protein [Buchnera aphidicola BCc]
MIENNKKKIQNNSFKKKSHIKNLDNKINNNNVNKIIKEKIYINNSYKTNANKVLFDSSALSSIPVYLTIELSKKKITIQELLQFKKGSILELEDNINKPLNIFINNYLIAIGELVVNNDCYGVQITKLLTNNVK